MRWLRKHTRDQRGGRKSSSRRVHLEPRSADGRPLSTGNPAGPRNWATGVELCPRCNGHGRSYGSTCGHCGGTGHVVIGIGGGA